MREQFQLFALRHLSSYANGLHLIHVPSVGEKGFFVVGGDMLRLMFVNKAYTRKGRITILLTFRSGAQGVL